MSTTKDRAKELSPTLVLTLLSIVQALALEVLWSSVKESEFLWEGTLHSAIGWAQVGVALQGIVVLWAAYVGLVIRFVWVPRILDVVVPFALGVFEFVLASALGAEWLLLWLLTLAGLFVVATVTNSHIFKAASELSENHEYFSNLLSEDAHALGWRAMYAPLVIFVGLILGAAVLIVVFGANTRIALVALLMTNLVLVLQFLQIRSYWNQFLFR